MADTSDEQIWWSTLFAGGVDPGLAIPDGTWESLVAAVFDVDTEPPADELLPADSFDSSVDALDDSAAFGHDVDDQPRHGESDVDDADPDHHLDTHLTYHNGNDHEFLDDAAGGDVASYGGDDDDQEM
jgi:hypothetical protein